MRTRRFIFVAAGMIIALLVAAVVAYVIIERGRFNHAVAQARAAYESSRSGITAPNDSSEFATRGLRGGMNPEQVNQVMAGAAERGFYKHERVDGKGTEYIAVFRFEYGPNYQNPLTGRNDVLFEERFEVRFDRNRRAYQVERHLFRRDSVDGKRQVFPLGDVRQEPERGHPD